MARISIPWKTYLHYKKNMNDSDRAIYQAMLDGLLEWKKTIPLPNITTDIDHIYDIYTMLLRDIPMLFHISNSLNITAGPNICYAVPEYIMDERTYRRRFQEVVDFLQNCKGLLSRRIL